MNKPTDQPFVSVVMPTYNQAVYIGEAIASVLSQSYSNFELIIIDNHSTDTTKDIVESFDDARIKYYKFHNNGVIAASRNCGVGKSSADYIAFIDSDDVWEPNKLKYQIPHLLDVSCVSSNFKKIGYLDESGNYLDSVIKDEYRDFYYNEVVLENPIITSSVLMRRDAFLFANGFDEDEDFRFIEDWELWLRLAYQEKIRVLKEPLVQYRIYSKTDRDLRDVRMRILKIFDKHFLMGLLSASVKRKAIGNNYITIGKASLNVGDFKGIVFYVKGLLLSHGIKNKLRSIAGVLLFLIPKSVRSVVIKKAYQFNDRFSGYVE